MGQCDMVAMNAMIDEAEARGALLRCLYQRMLFTPDELRKAQADGHFRWGVVNWELVTLPAQIEEAEHRIDECTEGLKNAKLAHSEALAAWAKRGSPRSECNITLRRL